jgi:hypothetical protein
MNDPRVDNNQSRYQEKIDGEGKILEPIENQQLAQVDFQRDPGEKFGTAIQPIGHLLKELPLFQLDG